MSTRIATEVADTEIADEGTLVSTSPLSVWHRSYSWRMGRREASEIRTSRRFEIIEEVTTLDWPHRCVGLSNHATSCATATFAVSPLLPSSSILRLLDRLGAPVVQPPQPGRRS